VEGLRLDEALEFLGPDRQCATAEVGQWQRRRQSARRTNLENPNQCQGM
jgi:hypothetical protein